MSRKLTGCARCLGWFDLQHEDGPRRVETPLPSDVCIRSDYFVCEGCERVATDAGQDPLDRTREHTVDGYLTTKTTRNLRGLGGKRGA